MARPSTTSTAVKRRASATTPEPAFFTILRSARNLPTVAVSAPMTEEDAPMTAHILKLPVSCDFSNSQPSAWPLGMSSRLATAASQSAQALAASAAWPSDAKNDGG